MTQTALADIRQQLGDRYTIERELGRGGMGAVYLARDLRLDRPVALKVLPPELAGDSSLRERFLRETRTAASFSHPNIVPVHAVEERDGVLAFAMGFVEGESVAERVRRAGPLDVRSVVRLLQDIGYALAYAHGRSVVHRDIKPDNIMLERATGRALLMDFGISRSIVAKVEPKGFTQGLTRVGEVVGTAEYMSPEQASGDVVDGRSDLYSLGLVALFALTGTPAITGNSTQQILVKQLTEALPPAISMRADLPEALAAAIDRCVAKEPGARFQTAEALVEAIDEARLAAPEIPLPIRLLAQELGTLGLVLVFLTIMSQLMLSAFQSRVGTAWAMIPGIFLGAIGFTRALQVSAAARRLSVLGFQPREIQAGLRATVDEHESMRQQLRADPDTRRRRKRTLIIAALQLPVALLLIQLSLNVQWSVGTKAQVVVDETARSQQATLGNLAMAATGLSLLGVSFLLFARSPFRMPVGERLFRLIWLGPLGRGFLRFSARGVTKRAEGTTMAGVTSPSVARAPTSNGAGRKRAITPIPGDRLAALESRVAELERWRRER
ncbi:MAG TPA: serine/threonine-protein kinase [Gemmatimonadaceae bacterium]|nr:serine/threonine-protein kinase [Gemmatimonadaceae bacterium]